ncbi:tetratricopeptide repeat protein [Sandaracinobacteroides saxicola]|uniref:Tetratricopeptide repeat protein n=1 Tax=Sandaracinobacteroides saxicola TaxID=2759707 RepID=A0A7G5IJ89_9SPHN|nr:hypothetical protein [Sandaracinobacteroides saxicola]QMW23431.1 hypothetical protein H3309_02700 [Sandaracinobacteroides saxicola]
MRHWLLVAVMMAAPLMAQPVVQSAREKARYDGCVRALESDAVKAEAFAAEWQALGGGLPARHCLALAQLKLGKPALAAATLARAAQAAEAAKEPFAADFWGQAGNAALLAGDAKMAMAHFNSALSGIGDFAPKRAAELHIDRARAAVEAGDRKQARADLTRAKALAPDNADGWLLSATLAREAGELVPAKADIDRALALGRTPAALLEAGNIAGLAGDVAAARGYWREVAPGSAEADAAARALAANPE